MKNKETCSYYDMISDAVANFVVAIFFELEEPVIRWPRARGDILLSISKKNLVGRVMFAGGYTTSTVTLPCVYPRGI